MGWLAAKHNKLRRKGQQAHGWQFAHLGKHLLIDQRLDRHRQGLIPLIPVSAPIRTKLTMSPFCKGGGQRPEKGVRQVGLHTV